MSHWELKMAGLNINRKLESACWEILVPQNQELTKFEPKISSLVSGLAVPLRMFRGF